jgi:hypothetical protein
MNFGFRYHVASLVAVFFSLILGILIGGALYPDHVLVDEQATVITELEERFREAQASLAQVKGELDEANSAWVQLLEALAKDLLTDKEVVLVARESLPDFLGDILKTAGAQVQQVAITDLEPPYPFNADAVQDLVFVFSLRDGPLSDQTLTAMRELGSAGAYLAYVWERQNFPSLGGLPPGLQVDSIDTAYGQLALLLGIKKGSQGHYGRQNGAQGLFP